MTDARPTRGFLLGLAGLVLLALAVRLLYAHLVNLPIGIGDDVWYHEVGKGLAEGEGFVDPFTSKVGDRAVPGDAGEPIQTAFHLPAFPALLAVVSKLGLTSYDAHQATGCVCGAGTVAVIGLIGRRLGGETLGLVAAGLGAVYLPLAINDSLTQVEALYGLMVALVILTALRLAANPTGRRALVLGAVLGLAALTRSEALALAVLLAPWVVRLAPGGWRRLALTATALVLVIAPWSIRNTAVFDEPVLLTTVDGSVIAGANLPSTYYGGLLGAWDYQGLYDTPAGRTLDPNEAVQSRRWRDEGLEYAGDHLTRLPAVIAVRELRMLSLYPFDPSERVSFTAFLYKHVRALEWPAMFSFYLVLGLAIAGIVRLRRRGGPVWPLVAPLLLVVVIAALAYGDTRFRAGAEPALVVLAAVTLEPALGRLRSRVRGPGRGARAGEAAPTAR
jgi:hypothetical protein